MNKEAKILGNQEEQKGIEKLLRQAGQDRVIDGVIRGEDPEKESGRIYHGIMLYEDKTLGLYTKYDKDAFESRRFREETVLHDWSSSPLTRKEILERARKDWRGKVRWAEQAIDKYIHWVEQAKPMVGFYAHRDFEELPEIMKKFEDAGIRVERRNCLCKSNLDYLITHQEILPMVSVIKPNFFIEAEYCWKDLRKVITSIPRTRFFIYAPHEDARKMKEEIGYHHRNLIYIGSSSELLEHMDYILEQLKQNKNE